MEADINEAVVVIKSMRDSRGNDLRVAVFGLYKGKGSSGHHQFNFDGEIQELDSFIAMGFNDFKISFDDALKDCVFILQSPKSKLIDEDTLILHHPFNNQSALAIENDNVYEDVSIEVDSENEKVEKPKAVASIKRSMSLNEFESEDENGTASKRRRMMPRSPQATRELGPKHHKNEMDIFLNRASNLDIQWDGLGQKFSKKELARLIHDWQQFKDKISCAVIADKQYKEKFNAMTNLLSFLTKR